MAPAEETNTMAAALEMAEEGPDSGPDAPHLVEAGCCRSLRGGMELRGGGCGGGGGAADRTRCLPGVSGGFGGDAQGSLRSLAHLAGLSRVHVKSAGFTACFLALYVCLSACHVCS